MAELSDDSLSDDDALKSDDGDGGGLGGLVFHWATDPLTYESSTWDTPV